MKPKTFKERNTTVVISSDAKKDLKVDTEKVKKHAASFKDLKTPKTPRKTAREDRKMELIPLVELCTRVVNAPCTNAMVI